MTQIGWVGFLISLVALAAVPGQCKAAGSAEKADMEVGIGLADITPPIGYRLCGYFHERRSTGTHDPLHVKALVLRQGEAEAAIAICDIIGISLDVSNRARKQASQKTGIPFGNIMVAATHSHTGPLYFGALRDGLHEAAVAEHGTDPCESLDYPSFLVERIVAAIARAHAEAEPMDLSVGSTEARGLSFNRRFHMKDGTVRFNPGKMNPNIVRVAGPIDPEVNILGFQMEGRTLASMTVFPLHLDTMGGTEYGADFPYYVEKVLKESLGDDFISIYGQGTTGDINHIDVSNKEPQKGGEETLRIGTALGKQITAQVPKLDPIEDPSLAVCRRVIEVPLQEFSEEQVAQAKENLPKIWEGGLSFLEKVENYKIVAVHARGGNTIQLETQVFRIDSDTAIVGLPGEIFVELGLAIKESSPFKNTFVMELCNDAPGYIPTEKAFAEGSYETVNSRVKSGGGEKLVKAALEGLVVLKGL